MNDDTELNKILDRQKIMPPSSNLSTRIIAAAEMHQDVPFWRIIGQEIGRMLYVPRPAYALAFSLILGIILGLQGEVEQVSEIQEWLSFMDASNDYLGEEWL